MRNLSLVVALALGAAAPAFAEDKPKGKPKPADETIDQIMQNAAEQAPPADDKPPQPAPAEPKPVDKPPEKKVAAAPAKGGAKPDAPPPPPTDDNDTTAEAAAPTKLEAVKPTGKPRVPGPYELGDLDCRMLDGAGIERVLPKKIVAGEEPDLLCRVLVTQPATVATAPHKLTLTVTVGDQATYQQARTVRVSSVGRRAIVFLIPADRISSEEAARVTMRAALSAPAKPPTREVKFVVEPAD